MTVALLCVRIGLAGVLAVAAVAKLADRQGTRLALRDFGLPAWAIAPVALLLPAVELVLAGGLLVAPAAPVCAAATAALMLAFSAAVARVLVRGQEASCSCFGRLSTRPVGPSTLARNLALAGAAVFVAVVGWRDPGPGVTDWSPSLSGVEAALVAALALLGLVAVVQAAFSWQLLAQNGRLAARIRALEEAATRIGPGDPLPELELTDTDGRAVSRSELLAGGEPVLVFTHAACEACEPVLAAIAQRQDAGGPRPVVIAGGDPEANREKAAAYGLAPFLLEPGGRAHRALGLDAVPAAVPLTAGGRIRVAPAVGPDAVRALVVPA